MTSALLGQAVGLPWIASHPIAYPAVLHIAGIALLLGFTLAGEKGEAVMRVEYLFAAGKVYALRSSPA